MIQLYLPTGLSSGFPSCHNSKNSSTSFDETSFTSAIPLSLQWKKNQTLWKQCWVQCTNTTDPTSYTCVLPPWELTQPRIHHSFVSSLNSWMHYSFHFKLACTTKPIYPSKNAVMNAQLQNNLHPGPMAVTLRNHQIKDICWPTSGL